MKYEIPVNKTIPPGGSIEIDITAAIARFTCDGVFGVDWKLEEWGREPNGDLWIIASKDGKRMKCTGLQISIEGTQP
jgi:hypothetical protein